MEDLAAIVETFVLVGGTLVLVAAAANLGLIVVVYKMVGGPVALTATSVSAALWALVMYL